MKQISEEKMLKTLDIPDWRYMTKDKVLEFASQMYKLDPEVAKQAISQFPNFSEMGINIVATLKDSLTEICESDDKHMDKAYAINEKILDKLEAQLNRPFQSAKTRENIINAMIEVSNNINKLESDRRHFVSDGFKTVATAAVAVISVAGAILGINIKKT